MHILSQSNILVLETELGLVDHYNQEICQEGAVYVNRLRDRQVALGARRGEVATEMYQLQLAGGRENVIDPQEDDGDMAGYVQTITYTNRCRVVERGRVEASATRVQVALDLGNMIAARLAAIAAREPQVAP
jgi:hypothetical protein